MRAPLLSTPSPSRLAERARALALQLERVALRKSRVPWELDVPLARRCAQVACQARSLAGALELSAATHASAAIQLNLAAHLVALQTETDRLVPVERPPAQDQSRS